MKNRYVIAFGERIREKDVRKMFYLMADVVDDFDMFTHIFKIIWGDYKTLNDPELKEYVPSCCEIATNLIREDTTYKIKIVDKKPKWIDYEIGIVEKRNYFNKINNLYFYDFKNFNKKVPMLEWRTDGICIYDDRLREIMK